jgi:glutamate N-acetyltransferase/amino-acid N-acetyltransferase
MKISPLAPKDGFPNLPTIDGVTFSAIAAGVRYQGRDDVMLASLCAGTAVAGVFTRSATRAAPVLDCEEKLGGDNASAAAFVVNSGNANAFTGGRGVAAVEAVTSSVAAVMEIPKDRVFTASTGVIGEPLEAERITNALTELKATLTPTGAERAASAIMTTDTFPKGASTTVDGITIAGFAKGSGMIAPDMATMLVYIFTDATIEQPRLQAILARLTDRTFNCITVDSDTSTSDTLLLAATGKGPEVTDEAAFEAALGDLMLDLAHQVVRDGEGATKFVEISVTGAQNHPDAHRAAMAIANSPLVKTAIAGEDPNWGRVVMAIGKSGAAADRDRLSISFGDILVAENGWVSPNYTEEAGATYMKAQDLKITVDLGLGEGVATVWTCDLTHGYIEINADYRS